MKPKDKIKKAIFSYFYSTIYHMLEDHQYALGDTLADEFTEAELASTANDSLEDEIHSQIMAKLDEIEKTL